MNLKKLQNKKIGILGLGIENQALVKFLLKKKVKCEITVCDSRKNIKKEAKFLRGSLISNQIKWQLGQSYDKNLEQFDILFRSPGWPLFDENIKNAKKKGAVISSPMKLFFELCPTKNIIGVTGTKGKGTTSSLIYEILKLDGKKVFLGGNIGVAPFKFIDKIQKNDWVVLELSSFQLEDMTVSPRIAVMTNFTREHLAPADPNNPNYHKTMKNYWMAKANIFKRQKKQDKLILNEKLKVKKLNVKSKIIYFTKSDLESNLMGEHNKENIAAAVEVARAINIKKGIITQAVKNFKSLEHRIEFVLESENIRYYNDSFATIPEATIIALRSFKRPTVLLAGGAEKNSDFKKLAEEIKERVKFVVLFKGKATPRLKKEIIQADFEKNKIAQAGSMREAVKIAKQNATIGNVVLLSPACASFGMFKNYKERGKKFKSLVKNI